MACRWPFALLALLLLLPMAPHVAEAQASSPLRIEALGDEVARLDTAHLSHRFRFRVTNLGDALDYVTIPRMDVRWTDTREPVAGFPSPEFGLSLDPGESGTMWVHVDVTDPRPVARTLEVPFRSERTGATTLLTRSVDVRAAPTAAHRILVRVDAPGATVEVTSLSASTLPEVRVAADPGGFSATVPPGRYAVRADAPGRSGVTRIVEVPGDGLEVRSSLPPARWTAAGAAPVGMNVGDSIWTLAGSADLTTLATAPMVHQALSSAGHFVGLDAEGVAWSVEFPGVLRSRDAAGPFQALDTTIAVSPDGTRAAGFDWNGRVHLVDTASGASLWTADRASDRNPSYPPNSAFGEGFYTSGAVAFSPDGTTLAAGGSNGWLAELDATTGSPRWTRAFPAEIRALRYTHDGERLVVGSGDWALHMLDAATGETAWTSDEPEFWPFFFLAESEDGSLLATGGKDSVYRVWSAANGTLLRSVDVFPAFVTGGGIGPWGGTFSDWVYGVRSFDADGDVTWFRRFQGANAATTPDGRFTLVGWFVAERGDSGLALLDDTGTTIWTSPAGMNAACSSQVSPFPAKQIKSVLLHQASATRLRYAAGCIGGGVFTGGIDVTELAAPATPATTPTPQTPATSAPTAQTPMASTPTPAAPTAPGTPSPAATSPAGTPSPTATSDAPFPPLGWILVALVAVALARGRR